MPVESYEPTRAGLCRIWKQLTEPQRAARLAEARRREGVLRTVAKRATGESERAAIKRLSDEDRSTFRRWKREYIRYGLDGLVDTRLPPKTEPMPESIREVICTLRRADPQCSVATLIAHVSQHHGYKVGASTVKTVLQSAGLARRPGAPSTAEHIGEVRLELAGMKLVEAAAIQTGYLGALTAAVTAMTSAAAETATLKEGSRPVDTSGRDKFGRLESGYNERYRKKPGDAIGPGYASVEVTRGAKDPTRFHVSQVDPEKPEVIERKVWALMVSPLLGNGRWDGIRVARGQLLGDLCGYPYMPSTLDLFTREWKFLGMSSPWWEVTRGCGFRRRRRGAIRVRRRCSTLTKPINRSGQSYSVSRPR